MTEQLKPRERIEWIDALRGFAIFCVVLGHCNLWVPAEKYLYSFHVFLFFFLSGFLYTEKLSPKEAVGKRVQKILVPFLAWNTLSSIIGLYLYDDWSRFIKNLFVLEGKLSWNRPVWFLLVLFLTESVCILLKLTKRKWISVVTIAICVFLWILFGHTWALWKLNLVPMALTFFLFGYLSKSAIPIINKWYVIILAAVGSVLFSSLNVRNIFTKGEFGNYAYCIASAVCGVLLYVGLFSHIKSGKYCRFLINWGKNSLFIMATQTFLFKIIYFVSEKFFDFQLHKYRSSVAAFLITIPIMIVLSLAAALIKRLTASVKPLKTIGEIFGLQY